MFIESKNTFSLQAFLSIGKHSDMFIFDYADLTNGLELTTDCEDDEVLFMSLERWTPGKAFLFG